jgi:hypothetical protein
MVERFFCDLTTKRIRRGTFASIDQLTAEIGDYILHHNADPKPIIWTAKGDDILEKSHVLAKRLINSNPCDALH